MRVSDLHEKQLLGSLLRWPAALDDVALVVRPEMFFPCADGPGGRLFQIMLDLQARRQPIDVATCTDELSRRSWLADFGGYDKIAELWDLLPSGAFAVEYAKRVRAAHLSRSLGSLANEMCQEALSPTQEPLEAVAAFEGRLWTLAEVGSEGSARPIAPDVDAAFDGYDARASGTGAVGLPTGWDDLDEITAGLHGSELVVVAARPGVGKTAFAGSLARFLAVDRGVPVFFASLEQSRRELTDRLLCAEALVDSHRFRKGRCSAGEINRLHQAGQRLRPAPLHIDDHGEQSMLRIAANARRLRRKVGIACVIVDYLQLVQPEDRRADRHLQVGAISRRLKFLARELDLPVVALAQLNRSVEDTKSPPKLSHLRESGAIEQDADTVILLHRPEPAPGLPPDVVLIETDVAKQRNGPTSKVTLAYRPQHLRFENYAPAFGPSW